MLTRLVLLIAVGALLSRAGLDGQYTRTLPARALSRARRTGMRTHRDPALGSRAVPERLAGELPAGQITIEQRPAIMGAPIAALAVAPQRSRGVVPVPPPQMSR